MEEKAIRGVPWTILSYGANKALTVAATIVLARLLAPEDFGVVALAMLAVGLISLFGDLGLGGVVVLRQDLTPTARGTVLSLMLGMSTLLAVVVVAVTPLAAGLLDEPRLQEIMPVLALTVLIGGFNWFHEVILQRDLEFRRRFLALSAQSVGYAGVAVASAALGAGIWSLVAGQVTGTLAYALVLALVTRLPVRPAFDREAAKDVLSTGRGFLAQGGLAFVKQNADYLAIGRVLGAAPLGLYVMAYRMAELPYWALADPVAKVTFPGLARMRARGQEVARTFLSVLQLVALFACPLGVLLSAVAEPFTRALFGEQWLGMVAPLAILGIWGALRPVHGISGWLLNAVGLAGLSARISAALLVLLVPALFAAAALGGLAWVAAAMLTEMTLALGAYAVAVARRGGVPLRDQWRSLRPIAIACIPLWVAARATAVGAADLPALVALVSAAAAGLVAYLLALRILEPGLQRRALQQMRRTVGAPRPAVPIAS